MVDGVRGFDYNELDRVDCTFSIFQSNLNGPIAGLPRIDSGKDFQSCRQNVKTTIHAQSTARNNPNNRDGKPLFHDGDFHIRDLDP